MATKNYTLSAKTGSRKRFGALLYAGLITPTLMLALIGGEAKAGQLSVSAFQTYNSSNASSIVPGPFSLYTVNVNSLLPTQVNEGFAEVGKKAAGFDLLAPSQLQANLITDIEPVVIGPGGKLYLTDGHHTFSALEDSIYGASNPTVYVNVIANYSNLTTAQFFAQMQANNLLLPLNDGVPQIVSPTGSPIPTSLTTLTSDVYRGLEYSILKNKSAKLFTTTANLTGAVGASTSGLDKMTGFYSDFLEAAAYRNANNGLGLPYLSPIDIALATQWNLNGANKTTLPNVAGTVSVAQLPGFILSKSIVNAGGISNATLANGALDGNGTFTGITTINAGTTANPITIGTPNTGFIMQLGADAGNTVTLNGTNTYTGGTQMLAGTLVVQNDAALGAATPTLVTIDPNNVKSSVQAANGIIFNSLTEGNAILTLGTTTGGTFATNRPIAVDGEVATINVNNNTVTLTGQIVSLGTIGIGIGNATGVSDITFDDLSSAGTGKVILSTASPYFYGNVIVGNSGSPTVEVMNDAALGNTTGGAASIGQVELNGGTLQAGASFAAPERNLFLGGGSSIDVNGFTTSWGTLTDVQRTIDILNSNTSKAGAITFNNLTISATASLQLAGGAAGETVTLTNGVVRTGNDTLIVNPTSSTSLGTTEKVFLGNGAASLVNGILPAWAVSNNGVSTKGAGPYDFLTYGANGVVDATYTSALSSSTGKNVIALAGNVTATGALAAYALNTEGKTIALGTNTLTLGDGTNPAGLILATGSSITGGKLAFGSSEGVIWLSGTNPTISSQITGTNGLTFAGSGGVTLSTAANVTGPITIDSGTVTLAATNVFAGDTVNMANTKTKPAAATLALTANNQLAALNTVGNNSSVNISNGAALTLGDTINNLSSTINATVAETGAATAGVITTNGSGLFDFSGGKISLIGGSTIVANNSSQFRVAASEFNTNTNYGIVLNGTSQLQFAQNGGGVLGPNITVSGSGSLHLIGGTLQITGTGNTYSGGTTVETGSILDVTTANLPASNPNIVNAGGLVVFDQSTTGTYNGVISDGLEMGTGPLMSGSFDKDDSSGANSGNVTFAKVQTYTGATNIEAGTLTLGVANAIASSSGVDLGRVGGGATASLVLSANNAINGLSSEANNTTNVSLGSNTLTINTRAGVTTNYGGTIGGTGSLAVTGAGTQILSGANTYSGGTTVAGGSLQLAGTGTLGAKTGTLAVSGGSLDLGGSTQTTGALTLTGGTIQNGTLNSSTYNVQSGAVSAILAGSGGLTKSGSGTVTLSGANTYTGGTIINAGTLALTGAGTIGSTSGSLTINGGTLDLGGKNLTTGALTLSGGTVQNGSVSSTFGIQSTGGTISGLGGQSFVSVTGGTTTLIGTNTYSGATIVQSGTLAAGSNQSFSASSNISLSGGTIDLGGYSQTSGALSMIGGTVQNGTLSASNYSVQSGVISANLAGAGNLIKTGLNSVTLSGVDTYTGGTSVTAGTLNTTGTLSSGLTNSAFVNAQGTILGAIQNNAGGVFTVTGALAGNSTFTNAGTLAVGSNSFTGITTLTNSGTITIGQGGKLVDDLNNTGTVTNAGTYVANVASNTGSITNNATWNGNITGNSSGGTITNAGSWTGMATNTGGTLTNTSTFTGAITNQSGILNNSGTIAGSVMNAGTATNTGTISGGLTNSGTFTASGTISGGVQNTGTFTIANALSLSGGKLQSTAGSVNLTTGSSVTSGTLNISGGSLVIGSGVTLTGSSLNIGSGAQFIASTATTVPSYTNAGTLDIRNGTASNTMTIGSYTGVAGSTVQVGVNFASRTADQLLVTTAAGTSQIAVTDLAPNVTAGYNPTGIAVVTASGSIGSGAFTLAGGPIQKGLFQYDLASNTTGFRLIGVPTADAYRLATLPTAVQSIWLDTAAAGSSHQQDMRDYVWSGTAKSQTGAAKSAGDVSVTGPGLWAVALGDWSSRNQTRGYQDLGNSYTYTTGYTQQTGAFIGGFDLGKESLFSPEDTVIVGVLGGYLSSTQKFNGSLGSATYEGGTLGVTATYLNHNVFVDGLVKGDFMHLTYGAPGVAGLANTKVGSDVRSYGAVVDTGYHFDIGNKSFIEPMATLAYVNAHVGGLAIAGTTTSFGNNDTLRFRIGSRIGALVVDTSEYRVDASATAGFWGRVSGTSTATINSGAGSPLLTLSDNPLPNYGDVGVKLDFASHKTGWTGYFQGDVKFANGYSAGSLTGGISYHF